MSIFPCDCPNCEVGVCDEDGICGNCGYDYLEDSDDVASDEDCCPDCGAELDSESEDEEECPECGGEI